MANDSAAWLRRFVRWVIWNLRGRPRTHIFDYLYDALLADLKAEQFEGGYPWPHL